MKLGVKKFNDGLVIRIEGVDRKEQNTIIAALCKRMKGNSTEPDVVSTFDAPLPMCDPTKTNC